MPRNRRILPIDPVVGRVHSQRRHMMRDGRIRLAFSVILLGACALPVTAEPADAVHVGGAKVDITPDYPVRLSGFASRKTESEGVTHKIWAKALAIGEDNPAVLVTVDNLGIPYSMTQEVARR